MFSHYLESWVQQSDQCHQQPVRHCEHRRQLWLVWIDPGSAQGGSAVLSVVCARDAEYCHENLSAPLQVLFTPPFSLLQPQSYRWTAASYADSFTPAATIIGVTLYLVIGATVVYLWHRGTLFWVCSYTTSWKCGHILYIQSIGQKCVHTVNWMTFLFLSHDYYI